MGRPTQGRAWLRLAAIAAVAGLAPEALAEPAYSAAFGRCMDGSARDPGGADFRMADCIAAETARQDAALNAAYRSLIDELPEARRPVLRDAQRLWVRYRDANCGFYADPDGGTAARLAAGGCVMSMTAERAAELLLLAAPD